MRFLEKINKKKFTLISIFLFSYVMLNLLDGERGLLSYYEKQKVIKQFSQEKKTLMRQLNLIEKRNSLLTDIIDIDYLETLYRTKFMVGKKINNPINPIKKKPNWIRSRILDSQNYFETKEIINKKRLHTVCQEASCPNISECWSKRHATFMIMGDICTRACAFCNVKTGKPTHLDPLEPTKIAQATKELKLKHVVITSVDRDDLEDGGAEHFSKTIQEIRKKNNQTTIEVLTPDFLRKGDVYKKVVSAAPDVFNHNIETVPSLYLKVRPGSKYFTSVNLLRSIKEINKKIFTKSGVMLGLGETRDEVLQVMDDLLEANVDFLTIGQYLQPSVKHYPLDRYVHPEEFAELKSIALLKGFLIVASSPLTRSSYHADEDFSKMKKLREKQAACHPLQ